MDEIKLRPYQARALEQGALAFASGARRVLFVAPTGAGKGTLASILLAREAEERRRALLLVHRREIVLDIADRVRDLGYEAGVLMPGQPRNDHAFVQVGSVQTMVGLPAAVKFCLVIADEAHHFMADEWREVVGRFSKARVVGLTATPQRADGRPLGDIFDHLIEVASYSELLRAGHLVPCKVLRPARPLDGEVALEPADAYVKYAMGRPAFLFTSSVVDAARQAKALRRVGVRARVIHALTPTTDRASTLEALRDGDIDVIANVDTMTEGVDVPRVDCVVLSRECRHASTYIQATGRALRPWPGKRQALLLDLCGASYRHGRPTDDRVYSLTGRQPIALSTGEVLRAAPNPRRRDPVVLDCILEEYSEESQRAQGSRAIDWNAQPLGREPDVKIAARLGVHNTTVRNKREERGIVAFNKLVNWEHQSDLGKVPDRVLADRLGVSIASVCHARKKLGIRAYRQAELAKGRLDPSAAHRSRAQERDL